MNSRRSGCSTQTAARRRRLFLHGFGCGPLPVRHNPGMWRTWSAPLCLALVAVLAVPAASEEADADGQADQNGRKVARWVLAGHTKTATAAENLLLSHLESGSLSPAFRRGFQEGLAAQPTQRDRLLDRWIARAEATGDEASAQRDSAVKLLGLAGEAGIRRLVDALRLGRIVQGAPQTAPPQGPIPPAEVETLASTQTPQVYDVNFLSARGTPATDIVKMLRVVASATEVEPLGEQYVVVAGRQGHKRLNMRLNVLRNGQRQQVAVPGVGGVAGDQERAAGDRQTPSHSPVPGSSPVPDRGDAPAPTAPAPVRPPTPDSSTPPAVKGSEATAGPDPEVRAWIVTSRVIRVPRHADLADRLAGWPEIDSRLAHELLGGPSGPSRVAYVVSTRATLKAWHAAAPRLRGAQTRQGRPLRVPHESEVRGFVGENLRYRRSVERADNGAWRVAQDFLPVGLEFRVRIGGPTDGTRAHVEARLLDLSGPMTPTQVRPEKGAEPIELDQVEWNRTSRRARFALPPAGAGAMLVVPHPGDEEGAWALLLLDFELAQPPEQAVQPAQQMGLPRNNAADPGKQRDAKK